jgi:uncharacterized SAM-binding protein YcdF (DUF218 family)
LRGLKKIILTTAILLFSYVAIVTIGLFSLDVTQKNISKPADIIVSLGGGDGDRVKKAWALQQDSYASTDKIIITGYPDDISNTIHLDPREIYLEKHKEIRYIPIPTRKAENTWEEALFIKQYMLKHAYDEVIIVTHPLHSRRVKMSLDKVAEFEEHGLDYSIVSSEEKKIDRIHAFLTDPRFRNYALSEIYKCIYYELKLLVRFE